MVRLVSSFLAMISLFFSPHLSRQTQSSIVQQIEITACLEGQVQTFTYTDQEKMGQILMYLRLLEPDLQHPIQPETFRADLYEIRLTMLDGSQCVYYQLYDLYLRKNSEGWYTISPVEGSMLHPLLLSLNADAL